MRPRSSAAARPTSSLAIVGAAVSVFVQVVKSTFGTSRYQTITVVIAGSMLAGGLYAFLGDTAAWPIVMKVVLIANGIYSFVIKSFEE